MLRHGIQRVLHVASPEAIEPPLMAFQLRRGHEALQVAGLQKMGLLGTKAMSYLIWGIFVPILAIWSLLLICMVFALFFSIFDR